jgi:hypothetical protein
MSSTKAILIPLESIKERILLLRGHKVMIDADLAELYGVETKRLNEQVKRNRNRFPDDFMFQLSPQEKAQVVANCDHLNQLKFSKTMPFAFTEHGAIQAANVLNSEQAAEMSVHVVRAFVRLRELLTSNKELAIKLEELERKLKTHDQAIAGILDAIRQLMMPDDSSHKPQIGFVRIEDKK